MTASRYFTAARLDGRARYNPDYAELEVYREPELRFRVLSAHTMEEWEGNGHDYVVYRTIRVKAPVPLSAEDAYAYMYSYFRAGCSCTHDCCGHLHGGVGDVERPRNRKKNEWIVRMSLRPSY